MPLHSVNRIIERELLRHRSVFLDGIGILYPEHRPAVFVSIQQVEPPYRTLCLSELPETEIAEASIITLIAISDGVTTDHAAQIYAQWIEWATDPEEVGVIIIDGIATIDTTTGRVDIDLDFDALLNPIAPGYDPIVRVPAPVAAPVGRSEQHLDRTQVDAQADNTTLRPHRHVRPKARNPHNYTISVVAIVVAVVAVCYILYYIATRMGLISINLLNQ